MPSNSPRRSRRCRGSIARVRVGAGVDCRGRVVMGGRTISRVARGLEGCAINDVLQRGLEGLQSARCQGASNNAGIVIVDGVLDGKLFLVREERG